MIGRFLTRFFVFVGLLLLPSPSLAKEDKAIEACFSAYEETQVRLKASEFEKARELARSCSSGCPKEIKEQCQTWAWEAERDAPSVLLVARYDSGEDAPDVSANIDGNWKPLLKEILLDPGPHTITFSRTDGWEYSIEVEIHPKEKGRTISALVPSDEPDVLAEEPLPVPKKSSHVGWAVASFSVSAIGFGAAGAFTLVALDGRAGLDNCAPNCTAEEVRYVRDWLTAADVGLAVGAVGLATGVAILIWGKPKAKAAAAQVGVFATASGLSTGVRGRF